jgi:hypothetical protein
MNVIPIGYLKMAGFRSLTNIRNSTNTRLKEIDFRSVITSSTWAVPIRSNVMESSHRPKDEMVVIFIPFCSVGNVFMTKKRQMIAVMVENSAFHTPAPQDEFL